MLKSSVSHGTCLIMKIISPRILPSCRQMLVDRLPQFKDAGQAVVIRERVVDQEGDTGCGKGFHATCHAQL